MKNIFKSAFVLLILLTALQVNMVYAQGKEDDVVEEAAKAKKEKAPKAPKTTTSVASDKPETITNTTEPTTTSTNNTKAKSKETTSSASSSSATVAIKEAKVEKVNDEELSKLKWRKKRKLGDKAMMKAYYYDAASLYQSAVSDKPKKWKLLWRLAESNMYSRNYEAATTYYNQLSQTKKGLKKFPLTKYRQGIALKEMGNYTAAIDTLNAFVNTPTTAEAILGMRRFARKEIAGIEMLDTLSKRKPMYKVEALGAAINSGYEEFAPFVMGNKMYYTTRVTGDMNNLRKQRSTPSYYSIQESSNGSGDWTFGVPSQEAVNKQKADVKDVIVSADGKYMYYTRTSEDAKGIVQSKIFVSENDGTGWGVGRPLNDNVNDPLSSSKQPMLAVNAEGKEMLFFASNRLTGKGGFDVFYSTKTESGEFGRAKSAGGTVNTVGDEVTPYFDASTNTLYFSSNGHMNIGGLDVFSATLNADGTEWSDASHLGTDINSSADDYYFRPDNNSKMAYFVSNRSGGQAVLCPTCTDDIYKARILKGNVIIMGTVNEDINGTVNLSSDAKVEIFNSANGTKLGETNVSNGRFSFEVDKENENVYLSSRKRDFETARVELPIGDYKEASMITTLTLRKTFTYVGTKIGSVYFDYNEFKLQPDAPDTLNKVVAFMKQFPNLVVEVSGHTDDIGSDMFNDSLGMKRASAVNRYVLSKEIDATQTIVKSYGKKMPMAPNKGPDGKDNPEGRMVNRRVDFTVVQEKK